MLRAAERGRYALLERIRIRREARRARRVPDEFDRMLGVQTQVAVGLRDLVRVIWRGGHEHEPSGPAHFRQIISALDVRFPETVFVDYGSGAGRAIVLASEFPFKEVIGVELLQTLDARARATVAAIQAAGHRRAPIRLVCADVTAWELPLDPLVIYLYNPFGPRAMRRVMVAIEASLTSRPRPVTIVACFCDIHARPVLEGRPAFRTVRSDRDVLVLRSRTS